MKSFSYNNLYQADLYNSKIFLERIMYVLIATKVWCLHLKSV